MRVLAGTSGFSYKEWKGSFYPESVAAAQMLAYYATRLPSVEVNNTFYRIPKLDVVATWAEQVGADFRFVVKASRRITHQQKLKNVGDSVAYLMAAIAPLQERLGAVLFQLPPTLRVDAALLRDFLAVLPGHCRAALEVRHPSWYVDAVYSLLAEHDVALCTGDAEAQADSPPFVATAGWGYLRLRAPDYSNVDIARWAERVTSQRWTEAYVFFKHEQKGPLLAEQFNALCGASDPSATSQRSSVAGTLLAKVPAAPLAKAPAGPLAKRGTARLAKASPKRPVRKKKAK